MYRAHVLIGVLLVAASTGFAQQQPDRSLNPDASTYTRDTYSRPVETSSGRGNWGLLGLLGLAGLLGRRRSEQTTVLRDRDEFTNVTEQRRRAS